MTIHYLLKKEEVKLTKKIKINFFRFRSQIVAAENPQSHLITNMKKKKKSGTFRIWICNSTLPLKIAFFSELLNFRRVIFVQSTFFILNLCKVPPNHDNIDCAKKARNSHLEVFSKLKFWKFSVKSLKTTCEGVHSFENV